MNQPLNKAKSWLIISSLKLYYMGLIHDLHPENHSVHPENRGFDSR